LTIYDYERIKKNAYIPTEEERLNSAIIKTEQEHDKYAKARALKEKLMNYDKNRPKYVLSDLDMEKIEQAHALETLAQRVKDNNEDCVKEMEKLCLYAKVATIRDRQRQEHKNMDKIYKNKEDKLDVMMELERLKELKLQADRENNRKILNKEGCLVVIDQIKEKERERMKQKEAIEKENQLMKAQIKAMQEEDIRKAEEKKLRDEMMAKEMVKANEINALNRKKRKLEEKELDLKMLKYNIEKAKKEEEALAEKKRIMAEKEKELAKLRAKQERALDKQAELDALMAKRAFEDNERKLRQKEREELALKQKKLEELLRENELQKKAKQEQLIEQVKKDKEEYEKIIKQQMEEREKERILEEEKQRKLYEHNLDIRKQIKLREEREKMKEREILEEGRKNKQILDDWLRRMERIKREKIQGLKNLNIEPKYIVDLEKYKIIK
jgi:hypothetical protein